MDDEFIRAFPARFLLVENREEWIRWRVPCSCGDPRDDLIFDIEIDKEINTLAMRIYGTVSTTRSKYRENVFLNFLGDLGRRMKVALQVLVLGYHEYDGEIVMISAEDIKDLGTILHKIVDYMDTNPSHPKV